MLHLATHFILGANDRDSALLLGDGSRLSLFDIGKDESLNFRDVKLPVVVQLDRELEMT